MSDRLSYPVNIMSKLLVLTERRVQQLANEGVVIKSGRGRYDLIKSVQGYISYLNEQIPNKQSNDAGVSFAKIDIAVEQAKLTKHKAELARLEEEEKKGYLVNKKTEEREMFRLGRIVRNSMLGIPSRISQELAAEGSSSNIHRMLEAELIEALTELADLAASSDELDAEKTLLVDENEECYHWNWLAK